MSRKYINSKREKLIDKWTSEFVEKLANREKWKLNEEQTLNHAKYLADQKWKRRQSMREIDTYIPLPNKWVKKLNEKRRKKGLL